MIKEEYGPQFHHRPRSNGDPARPPVYTTPDPTRPDPYTVPIPPSPPPHTHSHSHERVIVKLLPERNVEKKTILKRRVLGVPTGG